MESCSWLCPEMRVVECMDCPWYLAFAGEREWLRGEGCNGKVSGGGEGRGEALVGMVGCLKGVGH